MCGELMRKHSLTLDIHNLVAVETETNRLGKLKSLDCPLSYFEGVSRADLHIAVENGPFSPNLAGTVAVDHKYYIRDNYVFCSEKTGRSSWKMEITGLEGNDIDVRFHGRIRGPAELLIPNYLVYNVAVNPLVEMLLLRRGYVRIHGVAVDKGGSAAVMVTRGGAHKTRIAMEALRSNGIYKLMGDDRAILGPDRTVLSYPVFSELVLFRSAHLADENISRLFDSVKLLRFLKAFSWDDCDRRLTICDKSHFNLIYIGAKQRGLRELSARRADRMEILSAIRNSNSLEMITGGIAAFAHVNFLYVMQAYSYVNPSSVVSEYWDRQSRELYSSFGDADVYRVDLPERYSQRILEWMTEPNRGSVP